MATPEELEALANRIDHEELWRWAGMDHDKMTPEQKDRMMAAVHLRRYASDRGNMLEQLKEGAQYMRGMRLERASRGTDQRGCGNIDWHRAINAESTRLTSGGQPFQHALHGKDDQRRSSARNTDVPV